MILHIDLTQYITLHVKSYVGMIHNATRANGRKAIEKLLEMRIFNRTLSFIHFLPLSRSQRAYLHQRFASIKPRRDS